MESFSTPPHAKLPWIANLATVAVVLASMGWSNGQRPVPASQSAALAAPAPEADRPARLPGAQPLPASPLATQATQATQAKWPAQTTSVAAEGLQAVGFTAISRR